VSRALPLVLLAFVALPGAHAGARAGCPRDAALGAVAYARGGPGPWVGTWAPRGHRMAAVTRRGGVVVGGPGLKTRRLVADGFGASSVAWDGAALVVGLDVGPTDL
jgi:hypothetical protein